MDLMEQIRLEAENYKVSSTRRVLYEVPEKIIESWTVCDFQAGAQALLNLLGRSATSEGHPPRVYLSPRDQEELSYPPGMLKPEDSEEYLSKIEHEALRAADLLEVEKLRKELKFLQAENEVFGIAAEKYGDLSCCYDAEDVCRVVWDAFQKSGEQLFKERQARKADLLEMERLRVKYDYRGRTIEGIERSISAALDTEREKNARLTAALEKIATGEGISNPEDCPEVAREALGEAGK